MKINGGKVGVAADFLIRLLAGKEMPSAEVNRLAEDAGICHRTLSRAKLVVSAKCRKLGGKDKGWVISVPENMQGRRFDVPKVNGRAMPSGSSEFRQISADWVRVDASGGNIGDKIDIPDNQPVGAGLHIKFGGLELKVDENFPTDKLAELLRELSPHGADFTGAPGLAVTGG